MIIVDGNIPQRNLFSIILFTFSETSIIPIGINIPNMAAKWPVSFRIYLSIIESIETNLNMLPQAAPLGSNEIIAQINRFLKSFLNLSICGKK
jgi:hypothetical protein